jgi:hypothetical protein
MAVGVYYVLVSLNYRWTARFNRATLIAFENAWALQFSVMLVYWGVLYQELRKEHGDSAGFIVGSIIVHFAYL